MTALEHAKRFIQKNAARTALVIVPLAMASSANASSIDFNADFGEFTAGGTVALASSGGTFTPLPNGTNAGVTFNGFQEYQIGSGGGVFSLTFTIFGSGSGALDVPSMPAHYEFDYDLSPNLTVSGFSSSVTFFINGVSRGSVGSLGLSEAGTLSLMGWPGTPTLSNWSVVLQASGVANLPFGEDGGITLNIPLLDIAPADTDPGTAVPEPASLLLFATGTGLLALRRRRLQRSRR